MSILGNSRVYEFEAALCLHRHLIHSFAWTQAHDLKFPSATSVVSSQTPFPRGQHPPLASGSVPFTDDDLYQVGRVGWRGDRRAELYPIQKWMTELIARSDYAFQNA
jgi:hypothetical protein